MGKQDGAFLVLTPLDHDFNFVTRLKLHLSFGVCDLGNGHQAFRLEADVHHHVGGRDLYNGAFEDIVLAGRRFGFQSVRLKSGCKIFHVMFFFWSDAHVGLLRGLSFRMMAWHSNKIFVGLCSRCFAGNGLRRWFKSTGCGVVKHF